MQRPCRAVLGAMTTPEAFQANGRLTEDLPSPGASPGEADCKVCVAVHIRPIIDSEATEACACCLTVTPGQPQVKSAQVLQVHQPAERCAPVCTLGQPSSKTPHNTELLCACTGALGSALTGLVNNHINNSSVQGCHLKAPSLTWSLVFQQCLPCSR